MEKEKLIIPTKKDKCLICGGKLKDDDIEFEDYYRLSRGHTINAGQYFVCFQCFQDKLLFNGHI